MFLGHFLFTLDTFAVGYITQPQNRAKNRTAETSASEIAMDIMVTLAIPEAEMLVCQFYCYAALCHLQSMIGFPRNTRASCLLLWSRNILGHKMC